MKRILAVIFAVCCVAVTVVPATANEKTFIINGETHTFTDLAERTGLDADKLEEFSVMYPDEFYRDAYEEYYATYTMESNAVPNAIGMIAYSSLSEMVKQEANPGYILISATNHTKLAPYIDFRHGHAGLVLNPEVTTMIHAPGPGHRSEMTSVYSMTSLREDTGMKIRLYRVKNASNSVAQKAANYAKANLNLRDYDFQARVDDEKVNCATLVWRAYNSQGIQLKKYFYTVTPESLVQDTKTVGVATINWQGNDDSFDLIQTSTINEKEE